MSLKKYLVLLLFITIGQHIKGIAQVNVTPNQTALALAQKLAGPGITILNPTLTCAANANGNFSVVSSNLGIDSGIVLTTGRASTLGGSYGINGPVAVNASTNNGTPGDPQLAPLALTTTYDACRLEFDLIPKGDSIRFDYVFGSEEYNNSTCGSYNDAFAFFISGPGITGQQNIARVPGTNIPVAVNSINSGVPSPTGNISNCTSMGPGSPFTTYYVNNTGNTITYKGFTTVLRAVSPVLPCSTYHLKLTIADGGNGLYDSGVFIKAGSLKTNTYSIKADSTPGSSTPIVVKGCLPGYITIKRSQATAGAQTIRYILSGSAVNGTDFNTIPDSVVIPAMDSVARITVNGLVTTINGVKTLKLYLISPYSCNGLEIIDSTSIDIYDGITTKVLTRDTIVCKGTSIPFHVDGNPLMTYSWSPAAGLNNPLVKDPVATPAITTTYVLTTSFPGSGCPPRTDPVHIEVHQPAVIDAGPDQTICTGDLDVRLNAVVVSAEQSDTYKWQGPGGFTSNILNPAFALTNGNSGVYIFSLTSNYCPVVKDSVKLSLVDPPLAPDVVSPVTFCRNRDTEPLKVDGKNLLWYTDATGGTGSIYVPYVPTDHTGTYVFYVSQTTNQCESKRSKIDIVVEKCCADNLFIPSAFTPNGDGRNDRFHINIGEEDIIVESRIFNRWGQLVFHGVKDEYWDGTYGGLPVDMGTYFYNILVSCKHGPLLTRKGEVTVVR